MPNTFRLVTVGLLALFAWKSVPALKAQITESPQTIEPGGVLMRMDAISLGAQPDSTAPNQYKVLALGNTLVSAGITDTVDLEVGTQLFLRSTVSKAGADHTEYGIGDLTLRPKWTFFKDSDSMAAIVPYVILPTHSKAVGNNSVEGGLIVPWERKLGVGFTASAMVEWDALRNTANTRYDQHGYASGFLKWKLGSTASAYAETTWSASTEGSGTDFGTVGAGATFSVSHAFEWDFEASRVVGQGRNAWAEVVRFRWKIL